MRKWEHESTTILSKHLFAALNEMRKADLLAGTIEKRTADRLATICYETIQVACDLIEDENVTTPTPDQPQ